jgi:5-methylcytosine-specific restriction endonuclease McrA
MKKLTTQQKKTKLRKKADKLLQELGRCTYKTCLVCRKPMSCLHHYHSKGKSSALRYEWDNLIPLCQGCHLHHHTGDPNIHNTVNEVKGKEWVKSLAEKRKETVKISISYYEDIIKTLETRIRCFYEPN